MNKYICLIGFSFVLSSCYYKNGCWYAPQYANCVQKNIKSNTQRFYKADGQPVSEEQKINDIKACGAIPDKNGNFLRAIWKNEGMNAVKKVGECMTAKGYDYDNVYN